ncbi:hypothetical protein ZWY2020_014746 [Hordeum vulgare]|nr:hypothetical protein ZWY2020_014746 [Hordeum vulgare]
MEPDLEMAAMRKKVEDEVLGTWLWDKELDSILQEQQERDDEGDYEYYEPDEPPGSDEEEEELHCGSSGYGYTFYYDDGNPYYVADMEERWENQIQFPPTMPSAKGSWGVWEGSLQVEGPCQLDSGLLSAQSLLPPLPKWENHVYGTFRDLRNNQLRNYVFEYSRDKPCKLKPGSCKLQPLLNPHQGIYANMKGSIGTLTLATTAASI